MATADRKDPYRGYNFRLEIDGITRSGFRECAGVDASSDPIDYREGTDKAYSPRKLPGLTKYSNITLKWGITDDASLWDWRKKVIDGKTERKNGSVILINEAGEEKIRWNFINAWPTKWTGPSFNATANEVAIETLEIVHEGVTKA
ncbi:MAG TPA: phage tail protein [Bryobacteraceae bacterium]|jgi:phage tail-like protein|nr:phage tail protein [Bryobacteraceae bacterium]